MSFEEERLISQLKESGKLAISRLCRLVKPMPYYLLKFEYIPSLLKKELIKITQSRGYTYVELTEKGVNQKDE